MARCGPRAGCSSRSGCSPRTARPWWSSSSRWNATSTGRLRLVYDSSRGSAGPRPGTTENGKAVPVEYGFLDGEVTYRAAYPLGPSQERLVSRTGSPSTASFPTTTRPAGSSCFLADPRPIGPDCVEGPAPADAEALARSIQSDPDFEATAPVAVTIGGLPALQIDVVAAPARAPARSGLQRPSRRVNEGARSTCSIFPEDRARVLAIATVADEDSFEAVLELAGAHRGLDRVPRGLKGHPSSAAWPRVCRA